MMATEKEKNIKCAEKIYTCMYFKNSFFALKYINGMRTTNTILLTADCVIMFGEILFCDNVDANC